MNGISPWTDNLTPVDESAMVSMNGLAGEANKDDGDEHEGGFLTYLIPAVIVGAIAFAISKHFNSKP